MRTTFSSVRGVLLLGAALLGCGKPAPPAAPPAADGVEEARRLLAEAGYPGGKGFPTLELVYNTAEWHKKIAATVQEMWRKNLGITVELRNLEWKVFLAQRGRGEYDIARSGFTGEYRDPHAFLSLFTSDSAFNSTGWSSKEFDGLILASDAEKDAAKRYALLARAERLLLEQAPLMPTHHYVSHNWIKPFVRGVETNYRDMHPLQVVTLEGEGRPADGVLVYHAGEEPGSLDPHLSHDMRGLKTLMHLFEGLANYDPKDASPVPAAAERWEVSEDGKTYTFHLREATWSNGDPVTAHDFAWSWRRLIDPRTASTYKDRMYFVKNGRAIAKGELGPEALGVRADGDRRFVVELEQPAPYFPQLVCLNIFFPVHRATVEKHGAGWTQPGVMVHNGPYRLTEWRVGDRQVFEKNPRYRAAPEVKLERFVWLTGDNIATAFRMYEAGECHWVFQAPLEQMDALMNRPDHLMGPYNATYFYTFNVRKKPLDDVRVRRALSLAIDREMITKKVLRGGEEPAQRLTPLLYPGYEVK